MARFDRLFGCTLRAGVLVASLLAGCAESEPARLDAAANGGNGAEDASAASGRGAARMDGGRGARTDAAIPPFIAKDASVKDGGAPAPADAGLDASMDASADASLDASADALVDADAASVPIAPCGREGVRLCSLEFLPDTDRLQPMAISADGSTVAGYAWDSATETQSSADYYPWSWTFATGTTRLSFSEQGGGSLFLFPRAVSEDGSRVLGSSDGNTAVLWSAPESYDILPFDVAADLSDDGTVVAGGLGANALRWTQAEGILSIGHLEATCAAPPCFQSSVALAMSGDGLVVVGYSGGKAFRWSQGQGMQEIPPPAPNAEAEFAEASATNRDGTVIVGCVQEYGTLRVRSMWRFTEAQGATDLGSLSGDANVYCQAALNADGSVVVGISSGRAFAWDAEHGMRELGAVLEEAGIDITGWTFANATGISADGKTIVGKGAYLERPVGFIVRLP